MSYFATEKVVVQTCNAYFNAILNEATVLYATFSE